MFKKILIANRGENRSAYHTHLQGDGHQDRSRILYGR
jgi:hypothetical protein